MSIMSIASVNGACIDSLRPVMDDLLGEEWNVKHSSSDARDEQQ